MTGRCRSMTILKRSLSNIPGPPLLSTLTAVSIALGSAWWLPVFFRPGGQGSLHFGRETDYNQNIEG